MKKTIAYIFLALTVLAGGSCTKHILDKVNFNGLPADQVWSDTTLANLYLNSLYNVVMPLWPANDNANTFPSSFHNTSDESNGGTTTLLQGKLTSESVTDFFASGTAGAYPYMRRINMLLANIDNYGLKPSQTAVIKAQAYFLRAYIYFDLLKIYGGIPYITKPEDWIADSLNVARTPTSACVDSIVADLNHCSVLPASWPATDFGRITRGAALAFKARVLLTWASPQFNPQNDPSRWQTAYTAAQHAYDTCTLDGYGLYSNFSRIALDISNGANHEPILFRPFNGVNASGNQYESYDNVTRPYSQSAGSGGTTNNPTWNLVSAFPMKDGYPITAASSTIPYDSVYYWKNRDPRFYATIVYNGAVYGLGNTPGRKQWMYTNITVDKGHVTATGFYCRKNIDTTQSAVNSQYGKTFWVELRFAEVMMNLAECANMTGNQAQAYTLLEQIRKRAGITANADGLYGLQAGMSQGQMQTAILNEREVEFAFEGKRYDDLRRTRTFDQLNGSYRQQMVVAFKSTYKVSDMEKVNATTGIAPVDTINVNGPDYTKYFTHTIVPITNENPINFLTIYYAYAIPSSNISKEPAMQQTIGWLYAGGMGTFDPTK
ncbi:MAG TPA: RagB/SusD family nutrient uptake outer membrane protein [Puia sp.]|uniref:RagB/SusD family nutrient uptake outer membrane protein n=1 Tax=Puia sp. TaxID=2045100 RepID=UPI002BC95CF3|nr:RagB/SusD family nutrient uptake outer membrane protein [Puia sp.]HVU98308.1 RagB/SusD family nutrient uptake outer membrane protein [Puia sp.]